jgi:hypothetical protein
METDQEIKVEMLEDILKAKPHDLLSEAATLGTVYGAMHNVYELQK